MTEGTTIGGDSAGLVEKLTLRLEAAERTLEFYARPETYHAVLFLSDPPCGEFMEDFAALSDDWQPLDGGHYLRPMPGARARAHLDAHPGDAAPSEATDEAPAA